MGGDDFVVREVFTIAPPGCDLLQYAQEEGAAVSEVVPIRRSLNHRVPEAEVSSAITTPPVAGLLLGSAEKTRGAAHRKVHLFLGLVAEVMNGALGPPHESGGLLHGPAFEVDQPDGLTVMLGQGGE